MNNNKLNDNCFCKKCGKKFSGLDDENSEICFRCWLKQEDERLKQEEQIKQTTLNEKYSFDNNDTFDTKTDKKNSHNFGFNFIGIISVIILIIGTICGIVNFFSNYIDTAETVGGGNIIIGLILLPLAIFGAIQIFRGFCEMCESGKINSHLSLILTILGYITLFVAISQI